MVFCCILEYTYRSSRKQTVSCLPRFFLASCCHAGNRLRSCHIPVQRQFSVLSVTRTDSRRKPLAWGPWADTPYGNLAAPPAALGSLPLRERNSCVRRRTKLPQATHRILPLCRLPNTPNITLFIPNTLFSLLHKFPSPLTIPYL